MVFKYICSLVILITSYITYVVVNQLDLTKELVLKNNKNCEKLAIPMATEDLAVFGDFIIGATFDSVPAFHKHFKASSCRPGSLISINLKTKSVVPIPTHGFPAEFQLNAHGIKIFNNNTLYVISHGYAKGGERIHLFDLNIVEGEIHATFKESYYFEGDYGMYNSIALIDEKHFFLTQWTPFADTEAGRDQSFWVGLSWLYLSLFRYEARLKFCRVLENAQVKCENKAEGKLSNGLFYENNLLFMSDSHDKSLSIFKVKENYELELIERLNIGYVTDNIYGKNGQVFVASIGSIWDLMQYGGAVSEDKVPITVPGGVTKVFLKDGKWTSETLIMQNDLSLTTSVVVTDKIVISSVHDPFVLICPNIVN